MASPVDGATDGDGLDVPFPIDRLGRVPRLAIGAGLFLGTFGAVVVVGWTLVRFPSPTADPHTFANQHAADWLPQLGAVGVGVGALLVLGAVGWSRRRSVRATPRRPVGDRGVEVLLITGVALAAVFVTAVSAESDYRWRPIVGGALVCVVSAWQARS